MPLILHYRGDRSSFDERHLVGPDVGDGFLKPVHAQYDLATDRTTVTFQHLLKENWPMPALVLAARILRDKMGLLYAEATMGSTVALRKLGVTDQVAAIMAATEAAKEQE
jgi:hypothetical protein